MNQSVDALLARHPELVRLGGRPPLATYLRLLWCHRAFVLTVPLGELRAQHQHTVLGRAWHLLNPILSAAVYYLVFGVVLGARTDVVNYPAFLVIGLFVFTYSSKCATAGARTIVTNARLLQSLTFPRATLPVAGVLRETIAQAPMVTVMLALVLLTGERPAWEWLLIVPVYALQALFNIGLSLVAARATFHFRDVEQILPYVLRLWLYVSGVFFAAERVPAGWARTLFDTNPMQVFLRLARGLLMGTGAAPEQWGAAAAWAGAALVAGFVFFQRREGDYGRGW
ncbi:MAG: ABC transporter permease [Nitriliruptorales bacterium]|nr:ABC transporter permease [Nitriliruptorales bacterium]